MGVAGRVGVVTVQWMVPTASKIPANVSISVYLSCGDHIIIMEQRVIGHCRSKESSESPLSQAEAHALRRQLKFGPRGGPRRLAFLYRGGCKVSGNICYPI